MSEERAQERRHAVEPAVPAGAYVEVIGSSHERLDGSTRYAAPGSLENPAKFPLNNLSGVRGKSFHGRHVEHTEDASGSTCGGAKLDVWVGGFVGMGEINFYAQEGVDSVGFLVLARFQFKPNHTHHGLERLRCAVIAAVDLKVNGAEIVYIALLRNREEMSHYLATQ